MNKNEHVDFDYKSKFEVFWQTENLTDFLMYELRDMDYEVCKVNKPIFRYDNVEYHIKSRIIGTSDIKSAINQIIKEVMNYDRIFLYKLQIIKREYTFNFVLRYEGINKGE